MQVESLRPVFVQHFSGDQWTISAQVIAPIWLSHDDAVRNGFGVFAGHRLIGSLWLPLSNALSLLGHRSVSEEMTHFEYRR
jgi:hypothetical protein